MLKKKFNSLSTVNKNIIKNSFWLVLGSMLSRLLLLLATILIAKYVSKVQYGEFGMIKSTINMFSVFAGLGLGVTATKFISQYKNIDKQKTSRIIGLSNLFSIIIGLLVLVIFLLFSEVLAKQINADHLAMQIKLSGIVLFFSALNGIQIGILDGLEKFKIISINTIFASIISFFSQVIGAKFYGLNGVILGFGLYFIVLYILNFISIRKYTVNHFKIHIFDFENFKEVKLIWQFSVPAVLSSLMVSPVVWITNSFLVNQQNGYEQMAVFDIGQQWRTTVLFIPAALCQIALPMLSSASKDDYDNILRKNIYLNLAISTMVVVGIIVALPFILKFYGDKYADAKATMIILLLSTILIAVNNVIGQAIASLNKMWIALFVNFIWALSLIIFSYISLVIYNFGVLGLAYSYLGSYLIHSIVQYLVYFNLRKAIV